MLKPRAVSNQLEMEYQARMSAFVRQNHPCKRDCPDRCGTCKLTCEKLKAYELKRNEFRWELLSDINGQRSIEKTISSAKRRNTERT